MQILPRITRLLPALPIGWLLFAPGTDAQIRQDLWATDGAVKTATVIGNTLYVGGSFSQVGPPVSGAAVIDAATGLAITPYPRVAGGEVTAVVPDGSGGWFLGGNFTHVRGMARARLARIDANGNVTPWNPLVSGQVMDMASANGLLYVGGILNDGSTTRTGSAFDVVTGALTSWDPAADAPIERIVPANGRVYISGSSIALVGGLPRDQVAAVDPVTGACLPWTSPLAGRVVIAASSRVYVSTNNSMVGANETTGQLEVSIPLVDGIHGGQVQDAVVDPVSGDVYFGGGFTSAGGLPRGSLAAIDVNGALTGWNPGANDKVQTLALGSGVIVAGGYFSTLGGQPRSHLGSVSSQTGAATSWNPRASDLVLSAEVGDGRICAGGHFTIMNGVSRSNTAALDLSSGSALPWNPAPNGQIFCLTAGAGVVYVSGNFNQIGGSSRNNFAAVDATTGVAASFQANMNPGDLNSVLAMIRFGNTLYCGGSFQIIGGVSRHFLAAVDATTGAVLPWDPNANAPVYVMAIDPPVGAETTANIYVGGSFTTVDGQPRNGVASINGSIGNVLLFNPNVTQVSNPPAFVYALALDINEFGTVQTVYIGGHFDHIAGDTRANAGAVTGTGSIRVWEPRPNGTVLTMALTSGKIYLGGGFTTIRSLARNGAGVVDASATVGAWNPDAQWPSPTGQVNTLVPVGNKVFIGGQFLWAQGWGSSYLAGILDAPVTAVPEEAPPAALTAVRAAPNPFSASTQVRFATSRDEHADVAIYDVTGRRVRYLHRGSLPAGDHAIPWEGKDGNGRALAAGIYFVRVRTPSMDVTSKIHHLR